jgi:hypothetical protein
MKLKQYRDQISAMFTGTREILSFLGVSVFVYCGITVLASLQNIYNILTFSVVPLSERILILSKLLFSGLAPTYSLESIIFIVLVLLVAFNVILITKLQAWRSSQSLHGFFSVLLASIFAGCGVCGGILLTFLAGVPGIASMHVSNYATLLAIVTICMLSMSAFLLLEEGTHGVLCTKNTSMVPKIVKEKP